LITALRLSTVLTLVAVVVATPPIAAAQPVSVGNVTAIARPTRYTGPCPGVVTLTGSISTSAPATVSYRWERGDGSVTPVREVRVGGAPRTVTTTWRLGTPAKVVHASVRLRVFSPGDVYSSEASFTVACGGAKEPTPTD
jgi:hypothetical protein